MKLTMSLLTFFMAWCFLLNGVRAEEAQSVEKGPTEEVKQILLEAAGQAVQIASQQNAYYSNEKIKIPFPPDLDDVQTQLSRAGEETAAQVTESVRLMNAVADEAAKSVGPLLQKAVTDLTIDDASAILAGDSSAATDYFKKKSESLKYSYKPTIQDAMNKVGIQKVWDPLLVVYSDLAENDPVVARNDPENVPEGFDLNFYLSERAMAGLYILMGEVEAKIRAKQ